MVFQPAETIFIRADCLTSIEEELDAAAKLFEKVMAEDDMTLALIGSDKTKAFAMHRAALGGAALAGEIYVCTHKDLGMVSAAIWFGPGREFYDSDEQREAGFNDLFRTFPQELQQWWLGYFLPKFSEATTKALGEEVKKDAWHLQLIAVLPEHQGKGIGTALVKPVFERVRLFYGLCCP
ncbi:hypothetical protein NEOLEDRAFT_1072725 [Neolentinus lepideus HHB14362 ss-1]|uniref:N-acetyltransferase domain-containing protein n=1 Tax=Neolentinus lepideus HHB14362 ss-1 TaxID=1314782 RepID=A0A165Q566_9AGAM|nr:hypothetical protein NEOLEDRAFT_1072725 [Neolentinus lepideus HHB14362 ss-1]